MGEKIVGGIKSLIIYGLGGCFVGFLLLPLFLDGNRNTVDAHREATATAIDTITPERAAHLRVLNAYRQSDQKIPPGASPKEIIAVLRSRYSKISAISLSGCSPEFRNDFIVLINSAAQVVNEYERFAAYAGSLPDDVVGVFLMGAFNGMTRGEIDGGATRIQNELDQAKQRFHIAIEEVQKAEIVLKKYE